MTRLASAPSPSTTSSFSASSYLSILLRVVLGHAVRFDWLLFLPLLAEAVLAFHLIVNVLWDRFSYVLTVEWLLARVINADFRPAYRGIVQRSSRP